jgi:hypothetical protein
MSSVPRVCDDSENWNEKIGKIRKRAGTLSSLSFMIF